MKTSAVPGLTRGGGGNEGVGVGGRAVGGKRRRGEGRERGVSEGEREGDKGVRRNRRNRNSNRTVHLYYLLGDSIVVRGDNGAIAHIPPVVPGSLECGRGGHF